MSRLERGALDVGGRAASWIGAGARDGRPLVVLGHGAGAPMTSPFMERASEGLVARGCCVVRFHFPYMERMAREGGRRPPDGAAVLLATWRAVLALVGRWRTEAAAAERAAVVIGGKSMGGRLASMLLAEDGEALGSVVGAVYLGYPLHPPGRPERLRAGHLPAVGVPQLFVSGTRDSLCDLELLRGVLAGVRHPPARLHVVEGGDHSLAVRGPAAAERTHAWLDATAEFVHACAGDGGAP